MGNTHVPPPVDFRVERCIKRFNMPLEKVQVLFKIFTKFDREGSGFVTTDDFFDHFLQYPRSGLTDSMLGLIESKNDATINFGEFVELVVTFACFEKVELLRYFFYVLDPHRIGLVEKNELKHFIMSIWRNEINSNIKEAFQYLELTDDGDGTFNFREVVTLSQKYPLIFYPLYELQVEIINRTLGEYWWENHKVHLNDEKEAEKKKELLMLEKQRKDAAKALESMNDDIVKKRMGIFFYLTPWRRGAERKKIAKIAAIESEMEKKFKNLKRN